MTHSIRFSGLPPTMSHTEIIKVWRNLMVTVLKNERIRRGLSQSQLAAATGMAQGWISYFETRQYPCGLKRAARISGLLGMDRTELFDVDGWAIVLDGTK